MDQSVPSTHVVVPTPSTDVVSLLLRRLWEQGKKPALGDLLAGAGELTAAQLVTLLEVDQWHRWDNGERVQAEDYLRLFPTLQADSEFGLQLVYGEYLLREQRGERPDVEEFVQRFPQFADRLRQQVELHRAMASTPRTHFHKDGNPSASIGVRRADSLGQFRIGSFHARGGLGEVYRAEDEELHRQVAIKRIRPEKAGDAQLRRRFLAEAEITAKLEHPGIVPIYRLVRGPDGEPYYAMRFIEGESLDAAIKLWHIPVAQATSLVEPQARTLVATVPDYNSLAFRQLLNRFISVCQTMAYVHSKKVIHRDLKPANVMLGKYGETLVVDWGLAKEVVSNQSCAARIDNDLDSIGREPQASPDASETQTGQALGTPAFMSPEQAAGRWDAVGPASDIYSLGAILYVLLTGKASVHGSTWPELQQRIQRGDIAAPRKVKPEVPKPLEAICLKAMAVSPADRYATAAGLAADVEHWLADESVTAHREAWPARVGRRLRRHRALTAAGVATLLAAAVFLAVVATLVANQNQALDAKNDALSEANKNLADEQQRTVKSLSHARGALDEMTSFVVHDLLARQVQLTEVHRHYMRKALAVYERFAEDTGNDLKSRNGVAMAYFRVGNLRARLGENQDAETAYREARNRFERLAAEAPNEPAHRRNLALVLNRLGILLQELGRLDEAAAEHAEAVKLREQLIIAFPDDADLQYQLGVSQTNRVGLLRTLGRLGEAEIEARRLVAVQQQLADAYPSNTEYLNSLALSHCNLGLLLSGLGRPSEAEAAFRQALTLQKHLTADSATVPGYRQDLAKFHVNLGTLLQSRGKLPDAAANFRQAIQLLTQLAKEFPAVPEYRAALSQARSSLAELLASEGRLSEADTEFHDVLALAERLAADAPTAAQPRQELAHILNNFGLLRRTQGRPAEAETLLRRALSLREEVVAKWPSNPTYRHERGNALSNLGMVLTDLNRSAEAETVLRSAVASNQALASEFPHVVEHQYALAASHGLLAYLFGKLRRTADAEAEFRNALALYEKLVDEVPTVPLYRQELARSRGNLGNLLQAQGRLAEAEAEYQKIVPIFERLAADFPSMPENRARLAISHFNLGVVYQSQGRAAEAEAAHRQALVVREKLVVDFPGVAEFAVALGDSCHTLAAIEEVKGRLDAVLMLLSQGIAALTAVKDPADRGLGLRPRLRQMHVERAQILAQLNRHAEAVADWDRGITLAADVDAGKMRVPRAQCLAHAGEHAKAAEEANALANAPDVAGDTLRKLASICALCAESAKNDVKLREIYAARAVGLLRQAVAKGYNDIAHLKKDDDLKPLREREDYQKLVKALEQRWIDGLLRDYAWPLLWGRPVW